MSKFILVTIIGDEVWGSGPALINVNYIISAMSHGPNSRLLIKVETSKNYATSVVILESFEDISKVVQLSEESELPIRRIRD